MSWFLSITNFDELKMVPEGQTYVQHTSPCVVVYMSCAGARPCLQNVLQTHPANWHPINAARSESPAPQHGPGAAHTAAGRCEGWETDSEGWEVSSQPESLWDCSPGRTTNLAVRYHRPELWRHRPTGTGNPINSQDLNPDAVTNFSGSRKLFH